MSACDFTIEHYEEIMEKLKKTGYKDTFFNEACLNDKELILRHDIDVDLESAYRMAFIENKYKIRATYFVLIRSPFYNIFDRANSDFIKGILDLGHQIGLHFDQAYYGLNDAENLIKNVDSEVQFLKACFGANVFAVSFHRPSKLILQSDIKLNNDLVNTYEEKFTKEFRYISDSRRMWKEDCLCKFFENTDTGRSIHRIQALVHPVWWTEKSMSAQDTMERLLLDKLKYFDSELGKNIGIYRKLYI